jgi:transketolase
MKDCKQLAKDMRLRALQMAYESGKNGSHLGGGLSVIEILATLYGRVLHADCQSPYDENRDRLVISKGHCVLAYYTALFEAGFFSENDLKEFEANGSFLHGHATRNIQRGIEFSGGSLSMGMSFAVGLALACKKKGLNNRVFVLVGDGECDEGLIWEAAMAAANFQLNNLVVIVDKNQLQYDGPTQVVMNQISLLDKFTAFGFDAIEVDGHNCEALERAFNRTSTKPQCVIADTIKGKGVSFMEGVKEWHHSTLSQEQYEKAREEVLSCC